MAGKFLYFAYGSNMLAQRLHIHNPSAVRNGLGKLMNWQLDFIGFSDFWDGAPATIVPVEKAIVLGTLWELDNCNLQDLDDQEGVSCGLYQVEHFPILMNNNENAIARVYIMTEKPTKPLHLFKIADIPVERQPSKTYLQCLVKGAIESGQPSWYVDKLKAIKHNGRVSLGMEELLELKDVKLKK